MIKTIVHNRLRMQRGLAFVAMFASTLTVVGVWREYFPPAPWYVQIGLGAFLYILFSWSIGLIDEKFFWKTENERHNQMNPQVIDIINRLERIERKLDD